MRDVTATVESIPLITASIMSKKLAGGAEALVLDEKCGGAAFMKTQEEAGALAKSMVAVGKAHGMKIRALITRMEEPLGWAIGNALEVMESVEILQGQHGDSVLARLSFRFAAEMLVAGGGAGALRDAATLVSEAVASGRALEVLKRFVALNGGDAAALEDFSRLPQAAGQEVIRADRDGFVTAIDGRALGIVAMELGAGRRELADLLDLGVGLRIHAPVGARVKKDDPLVTLFLGGRHPPDPGQILSAFSLSTQALPENPWLLGVVE